MPRQKKTPRQHFTFVPLPPEDNVDVFYDNIKVSFEPIEISLTGIEIKTLVSRGIQPDTTSIEQSSIETNFDISFSVKTAHLKIETPQIEFLMWVPNYQEIENFLALGRNNDPNFNMTPVIVDVYLVLEAQSYSYVNSILERATPNHILTIHSTMFLLTTYNSKANLPYWNTLYDLTYDAIIDEGQDPENVLPPKD
jgi:hypothetical protein